MDRIGITEACKLLNVSRPTFNAYRIKFKLRHSNDGRKLFFSRQEILMKIPPKIAGEPVDLIIVDDAIIAEIIIAEGVYDLRKINLIDPHGILSLLCSVIAKANEGGAVQLLVEDSFPIQKLHSLGFFHELERTQLKNITWDRSVLTGLASMDTDTFLPIQYIGHKGGERQSSEDLIRLLIKHGFSEDIGASIGWIFGELADNALTHSKGPCYLMCQRFITPEKDDLNYLAIAVADVGVGIHHSLRTNSKYAGLGEKEALITAFKSNVSSWSDEHKRGKGLTDVLSIFLGNHSYFRVDSGDMAFRVDWGKQALILKPMCDVPGTRHSIVLTDGKFDRVNREAADAFVDKLIKTI